MIHNKIHFSELELLIQDVFREIGYGKTCPDEFVSDMVKELFSQLEVLVVAEYVFCIYSGEVQEKSLSIETQTILEVGPVIAPLMKGADSFAVFIATSGHAFEAFLQDMIREGDLLQTFLVDVIGSCIAEKAGDYMERSLKKEIGGLLHTNRFSPGYCNWSLKEQQKIFNLLPESPCGVTLSEVCLMNPIKSISGIIGIGEDVKRKQYACNLCELETCYKRKQKKIII